MNEKTRQLILLTGIMSILVAGLIVVTTVNSTSQQNSDIDNQEPTEVNLTNDTNKEPVINDSDSQKNVSDKEGDSNVIIQAIEGWKALWKDMKTGWTAILNLSNSSS